MKLKLILLTASLMTIGLSAKNKQSVFPDGTAIPQWFNDTTKVNVDNLGRKYVITDYGVKNDSSIVQTEQIQKVIDTAYANGGGVIVFPKGTFLSGSIFFKQGTHLYMSDGATLKGIDAIKYYNIVKTRLEGQTLDYFSALVNADGLNGFTISGNGTINGNGTRFWEEFWIRRRINRDCTNLEAMRPRLVYISNCTNVQVQDVHLINSGFWTNHIYRSNHVKYINCYIYAPTSGIKAPSSDAIDIDYCHDVLVHGCYMSVNDDAVVLKGGKGTWADKDTTNGPNYNIIVEDCRYGVVHGCLTFGSESLNDHNIIFRRCYVHDANRVIWLKMRPDTPQHYEYLSVENVTGDCASFLVVRPWTQFYNIEKRDDMPMSMCNNIMFRNINVKSDNFLDVGKSEKYVLKDFYFENCNVKNDADLLEEGTIQNMKLKNVRINGKKVDKF